MNNIEKEKVLAEGEVKYIRRGRGWGSYYIIFSGLEKYASLTIISIKGGETILENIVCLPTDTKTRRWIKTTGEVVMGDVQEYTHKNPSWGMNEEEGLNKLSSIENDEDSEEEEEVIQ